jgi:uncharacterized protein
MSTALMMGLLTGVVFGTALYKVAAIRHTRVIGMLLFADGTVYKFAFSAIAVACFGYGLAATTGVAESLGLVPRVMSFTGWAHVLGGVIFGVSMAGTGCCPGTTVCRASSGIGSGRFEGWTAVIGLFVGIFIYSLIKQPLFDAGIMTAPQGLTLHGWLGLPYGPVAMFLGVFFLVVATLIDRVGGAPTPLPKAEGIVARIRGPWHWLPAGAIAGVVIVWATSQSGYVGYSGSVLAIYGWAADALGMTTTLVPKISDGIIWRAGLLGGVGLGAFLASKWSTRHTWPSVEDTQGARSFNVKGHLFSFTGGTGLALGAMIGGGCTTGAFMAAFPTLSLGSFAMGGTFFAVALITARIVNRVRPYKIEGELV